MRTVDAGTYQIRLGAGLRRSFATLIAEAAPAHRYALVSDEHVAPRYAADLMAGLARHGIVSTHVVAAGEQHKTRASWTRITDEMLDAGCARDTTVVALGGGVVGDLAGFVAATFMRGVPVVQCPTTLLAMIDASIGGKTGVDTEYGKNLVGAFHPPVAVLADVEVIASLPLAHRRSGLAEAIKHGAIADASYFARVDAALDAVLDASPSETLEIVAESVRIKSDVVRGDFRETGRRKTLNFGHTLGHAIEQASGYALLHGECVAIGMVLEARVAEEMGVAQRGTCAALERVLERAGLPTTRPRDVDGESILEHTRRDKKSRGGTVEYALPTRIGAMAEASGRWSVPVEETLVREILA